MTTCIFGGLKNSADDQISTPMSTGQVEKELKKKKKQINTYLDYLK